MLSESTVYSPQSIVRPVLVIGYWLLVIGILLAPYTARAVVIPNDPFYGQQWYLPKVGAPVAWETTTGSREIIVAVLDTGVDIEHPDIKANIWRNSGEVVGDGIDNDRNGFVDDTNGWNFVEKNNNPRPATASRSTQTALVHGTLIAGIIAGIGNNNEGISGIGWQTRIMPLRVLDSEGEGSSTNVIAGLRYAIANGAQIANLSFTTFDNIPEFAAVIREARDRGMIVVAAAGNEDGGVDMDQRPVYPACTDGPAGENWVIGVAATDRDDRKSRFSNFGSLCVDISAPGQEMFGAEFGITSRSSPYGGGWAGTSLAAPIISGAAALIRSIAPNLSRSEIINVLLAAADPIDTNNQSFRGKLGRGRVSIAGALTKALERSRITPRARLIAAGDVGTPPRIWSFDRNGTLLGAFLAYPETFRGGIRLATGDVDGDGLGEIIVAPGPGGGPHIRVFDQNGALKTQFFAFDERFKAGLTVAAGDLDGDGTAEIVVGSGPGSGPSVKVFTGAGLPRAEFQPYSPFFTGGVEVAAGDVDGNGLSEIIVGPQKNGGPHIRIFDGSGKLKNQFFAYEKNYRAGVRLAVGDVDGNRVPEILVTEGKANGSIKIFDREGKLQNTITAFLPRAATTIAPGAFDLDSDGKFEIVTAVGGIQPIMRAFNRIGALTTAFALPSELKTALRIATF